MRTFALVFVVLAACGGKSTPPAQPISNGTTGPAAAAASPAPHVSDGALWTCTIQDYDAQPCKFVQEGGQWMLRKLLGSQRFKGSVEFTGDGSFRFVGTYFCPWGACDENMDLLFKRDHGDHYVEEGGLIQVEWNEDNAAAFGGAGYGNLTGDEQ